MISNRAFLRTFTAVLALIATLALTTRAAAPKAKPGPKDPAPSTRTFFIEGVKSAADVQAVTAAASKVNTVSNVVDLTPASGFANISFDHHAVTHQQIAQAIADAGPFKVSFKFLVPDYAKDAETAKKMDAVFARFAKSVSIEALDKAKGLFVIRFLPFTPGPAGQPLANGFNFGHIAHPIIDPAPKGMGLRIQQVAEGSLAKETAAAKKKGKK
jgi:copper chaperone CopZ